MADQRNRQDLLALAHMIANGIDVAPGDEYATGWEIDPQTKQSRRTVAIATPAAIAEARILAEAIE
jgi:hypothetical protein